ncbi:MAG: hypothetical protein HOP13_07420 [Alphaproteobacteria bacterium]|nr:hypothetical protein [Alphaproteobacteria bacterium]
MVVIDSTDALAPNERRAISDEVANIVGGLSVGELISVHFLDSTTQSGLSDATFHKCKPRNGQSANFVNENPRFVQKVYEEEFERPLLAAAASAQANGGALAQTSPIIEAIFDASRMSWFEDAVGHRRLVIFSDLLQNSPILRQYRNPTAYATFAASDRTGVAAPELSGVDVEVFKIARSDDRGGGQQTAMHEKFWQDYFAAAHVRSLKIRRIR